MMGASFQCLLGAVDTYDNKKRGDYRHPSRAYRLSHCPYSRTSNCRAPRRCAIYMAAPHNKGHARGNKPTAFSGVEGVIIASLRTSTCCLVSDCKFEFARFIYAKDKTWVNVFPLCMCRLDGHNPQADGRCRKGRHCKNTKKDLNFW